MCGVVKSYVPVSDFPPDQYWPQEILHYRQVNDFFFESRLEPIMFWFNESSLIKKFSSSHKYKNMINNCTSAATLSYSDIRKNGFWSGDNVGDYLRYDHTSYTCFDFTLEHIMETSSIESGEALLRVNKEKNVIYTVRKTQGTCGNPEYVFRAFTLSIRGGNSQNIQAILQSHCCIEQLPDILFLKNNIHLGITSLDDIKNNIPDTKVSFNEDKGFSTYACADKYGSIVRIRYAKDKYGVFRVENVDWTCSGYNVLPYLLPIDRQLIDPDYPLLEGTEKSGDVKDSCCNVM